MSEKIVSVDIRMVVTPTGYTSCSIGSTYIPPGDWTPAMHAAAEELRAQGASERVGGRCHHCGHYETSLQRAEEKYAHCPSCDRHTRWLPVHDGTCNGTGRKTEESDGETEDMRRVLPSLPVERRSVDMHAPDATDNEDRADEAGATVSPERPVGIPASATIWAEVVDGLGRKVGAWFVPPFMKGDLGHVDMYDPEQPSAPWAWSPRFDERLTPSAAAQCRQLYEKGIAHLTAEATPKPTLTAVDLTELREAWKAVPDFQPHPITKPVRALFDAVEKLLSSGGAP